MKVFVNYPENINELNSKVAEFHATLLLEKIKQTNVDDKTKQELLDKILEQLKNTI